MKIYLAGVYPEGLYRATTDKAYLYRKPWKKYKPLYYLESYYEIRNHQGIVDCIRKRGDKIILDSGAFSAFTQGVVVDLKDYAEFIKRNRDIIEVAANFDVIGAGGEQQSYDNLKELESYGADVKPVHHARDKDKWIKRYLKEGYDFIFLGGLVPESIPYKKAWLDKMWTNFLSKKSGKPKVKVHHFGMTVEHLMARYPCYSVDSTSYKMYSIRGYIVLPVRDRYLVSVNMSTRHGSYKIRGQNYHHYSEGEKEYIDNIIKSKGFKPKKLVYDRAGRSVFNILMYRDFMNNYPFPNKFVNLQPTLFG